jgi:hypothetical protein
LGDSVFFLIDEALGSGTFLMGHLPVIVVALGIWR